MRSSAQVLVVAFALLLPSVAAASEFRLLPGGLPYGDLQLTLHEPGIVFGPAGASVDKTFPSDDRLMINDVLAETPWQSSFHYEVTIETGPLVSLTVDDSDPEAGSSEYVFTGGTFTLTAFWGDEFGNPKQGRYIAPVEELDILIWCEQELTVMNCNPDSGARYSIGDALLSIGDGLFDHSLARALGVQRQGDNFSVTIPLDGIDGSPSDNSRVSGSAAGRVDVAIGVTVPEPSILSLLLLVPVVGRRFRR